MSNRVSVITSVKSQDNNRTSVAELGNTSRDRKEDAELDTSAVLLKEDYSWQSLYDRFLPGFLSEDYSLSEIIPTFPKTYSGDDTSGNFSMGTTAEDSPATDMGTVENNDLQCYAGIYEGTQLVNIPGIYNETLYNSISEYLRSTVTYDTLGSYESNYLNAMVPGIAMECTCNAPDNMYITETTSPETFEDPVNITDLMETTYMEPIGPGTYSNPGIGNTMWCPVDHKTKTDAVTCVDLTLKSEAGTPTATYGYSKKITAPETHMDHTMGSASGKYQEHPGTVTDKYPILTNALQSPMAITLGTNEYPTERCDSGIQVDTEMDICMDPFCDCNSRNNNTFDTPASPKADNREKVLEDTRTNIEDYFFDPMLKKLLTQYGVS